MLRESLLHNEQGGNVSRKFTVLTQVLCLVVAGSLYLLRCFVRLGFSSIPRQWSLQDWMVTIAFLGLLAFNSLVSIMAGHHAGHHMDRLTDPEVQMIRFYFWILTIVYEPVILCTKLSILLLYRHLLVPRRRSPLYSTIYGIGTLCTIYYTTNTFVRIFACTPIAKSWNNAIKGHCLDSMANLVFSGAFNIATDLAILIVPIIACWNLHLGVRKRLGLFAVLTIGAAAPAVSAVGFAVRISVSRSPDITFMCLQLQLCVVAEITVGVICVCLPFVPSLFRRERTRYTGGSDVLSGFSRQRTSSHEAILRRSAESGMMSLEEPRAAMVAQSRRAMLPRAEFNRLDKRNKTLVVQCEDQAATLLDFLAESGRIDDGAGRAAEGKR